jgi:hypothetical protein
VAHASSTTAAHASSTIADRARLTIGVLRFAIGRPTRTADHATMTGANSSHGRRASRGSLVHDGGQALVRVLVHAAEVAALQVDDPVAAVALAQDAHRLAAAS